MTELPDLSRLTHDEKDTLIRALWAQVQALTAQVQTLAARVAELEARLGPPPKTPDNSSLPPSQGKKLNRAEKVPRHGPRPGSLGRTGGGRALAETPDEIVIAKPARCAHCQAALGEADHVLHGRRDKIDLPQVAPVVTRVEQYAGRCRCCGATTLAPVPEGLEPGTPFSVGIVALAMYLRFVHAVSYQRLSRLLLELFGLVISEGALDAAFRRGKPLFDADVAAILARLRCARVVCSDETSVRIDGRTCCASTAAPADGVDGPRRHRVCQNEVGVDLKQRRPSVDQISRIGMDTSKHVFQLHGVNAAEAVVLRRKLRRKEMVAFFEKLAPTVIAIEACGASHHWARLLHSFGHTVKLIPPQLVKPYVKRGKNDAADAEALCEAMSRPTMRFVPVKSPEQQAALMLVSVRDRLIRNRTQLANAIRGHAAEFGLTAAKGMAHLVPLLERIQADESLPALARELFATQAKEYEQLQTRIGEVDAQLLAQHRADECSRRLAKIPGVGPVGAMLLRMKTPEPELFRSGRQFAAWIGLTPRDHSTAGKVRLGVITRAGDEGLRSVLVVGATAVIQQAQRRGRASPWLAALLKRRSPKLAAVALANKTARIAWKLMLTGEAYTAPPAPAALAGAA